jgi:polyphenol oxidase
MTSSTTKAPRNRAITRQESAIPATDALFVAAGLVRSPRGRLGAKAESARFESADAEDFTAPAPVTRVALNGVEWLPVSGWEGDKWLWHGFSTRRGGLSRAYCAEDDAGELNLGLTPDDNRELVLENRRLLTEAVSGSKETPLITVSQIHSNVVVVHGGPESARAACSPRAPKGDGLMTDRPGVLLAIQTADCIPVLVADRKRRAVAAFHAGWRGTVRRIVESGIGRMRMEYGSRPEDLVAAIGPGIGPCCYAVGDEVLSSFESQFPYFRDLFREVSDSDPVKMKYPMLFLTQRAPGHSPIGPSLHVNLIEANRRQLLDAGLKAKSIRVVGGCTSCQPELFFSHRASKGRAGRMMAVIGMREDAGPQQS